MNRLEELRQAGVSIWLDTLSRELLESDRLERYVRHYGVTGATSNPAVFERAITGGMSRYRGQLLDLAESGVEDPGEAFLGLALEDVRWASDVLAHAHSSSRGRDGFVSFQLTPDTADDSAAMVAQALALRERLPRSNVMLKVPGTPAGVDALEELTARGVSVNVTLLFSVERYEQVVEGYLRGLERRAGEGLDLHGVASVASFFVSRIDGKVDGLLPPGSPLRGAVAIAAARTVHSRYASLLARERWRRLAHLGARPQRPLWASTGTKAREYRDVLYVEGLILRDSINTMPEHTLRAFAEHGLVGPVDEPDPEAVLDAAAGAGVDLAAVAAELEHEGLEAFRRSYESVLERLQRELVAIEAPAAA